MSLPQGGSDIRASNVMADRSGGLKLVDPVFIAGRKIVEAIETGDRARLRGFTHSQIEDFFSIAVFAPGGQGTQDVTRSGPALRRYMARAKSHANWRNRHLGS